MLFRRKTIPEMERELKQLKRRRRVESVKESITAKKQRLKTEIKTLKKPYTLRGRIRRWGDPNVSWGQAFEKGYGGFQKSVSTIQKPFQVLSRHQPDFSEIAGEKTKIPKRPIQRHPKKIVYF